MTTNTIAPKMFDVPFFKRIGNKKSVYKKVHIVPAVNIKETEEHYLISVAIPGFKKEDFKIVIANNIITISAAKEFEPLISVNDHCEYDYSNWTRSIKLPGNAEAVLAKAKYREGELIIRIPKGTITQSKEPIIVYIY